MGFWSRGRARRAALPLVLPLALLLALTAALAGCDAVSRAGDGAEPGPATSPSITAVPIRPAALLPGDPAPKVRRDDVLFTVTGRIGKRNRTDALVVDAATLRRLGVSRVDVFEPWTKQNLGFRGLWLADLLRFAGADPDATAIHASALDEYQVDLSAAEIRAGGIFLATTDGDGKALPIEDGGPTRIVFVGGVASGANADQWIWSLKNLDLR